MQFIHLSLIKTLLANSLVLSLPINRISSFKQSIRVKVWYTEFYASISFIHLSIKSGAVFTKTDNVLLSSKH